jgi:hypothetical protein
LGEDGSQKIGDRRKKTGERRQEKEDEKKEDEKKEDEKKEDEKTEDRRQEMTRWALRPLVRCTSTAASRAARRSWSSTT